MNKEQRREYDRGYYLKNKEKKKAKDKRYRETHKEQVNKKWLRWVKNNPSKSSAIQRRHHQKLRKDILAHYGNGRLVCVSCGFDNLDCLTLHHVNNDGEKDRREYKCLYTFFNKLRKENYPEGYQTLCMNCQWIKKAENQKGKGCLPSK